MENNITFEQAMSRLEKIVRELENGEVALEDSIKNIKNNRDRELSLIK